MLSDCIFGLARRDLDSSIAVIDRTSSLPCLVELKALRAALSYKRALYHLAGAKFAEAAEAFTQAMQIYESVGRRSTVPSMAAHAALSRLAIGEREAADALFGVVKRYEEMELPLIR